MQKKEVDHPTTSLLITCTACCFEIKGKHFWMGVCFIQAKSKQKDHSQIGSRAICVCVCTFFILAVLYFLFAFYDFGLLEMSRPAWAVHRLVVHSVGFHSTSTSFVIPMLLHVSRFWSL